MPKKRTVAPFYTKRMTRMAVNAQRLPLMQRLSVYAGIAEALRVRRSPTRA
ncbi:hypothetical protein ISN75_14005 [Dyella marensis]|uniref:hypothetical protein n=1 Tax=Dyella marensis TaxID=500610 RepID=UPI0031E2DC8E